MKSQFPVDVQFGDMAILRDTNILSSGKSEEMIPYCFHLGSWHPDFWHVGTALGQKSISYCYFLWTLKDPAWSAILISCGRIWFATLFWTSEIYASILVRVYETLNYFHDRRKDRKKKWLNFLLKWGPSLKMAVYPNWWGNS